MYVTISFNKETSLNEALNFFYGYDFWASEDNYVLCYDAC